MGHYSDYYDEEERQAKVERAKKVDKVLDDITRTMSTEEKEEVIWLIKSRKTLVAFLDLAKSDRKIYI